MSSDQQRQLFDRIRPRYERLVADKLPRSLVSRLFQHEFDAVASLAWNTQHFGTYACNMDMNRLDLVRAIQSWVTLTAGGPGILDRRLRETAMFRDAAYMAKPVVGPNSVLMPTPRRGLDPHTTPPPPNVPATGGRRV